MIERGWREGGAAGPQAAPLRGAAAQQESEQEKERGFSLSSPPAYLISAEGRAPVQRQSPYQLRFVWGVITAPGREAFLQVGGGEAARWVWGCRVCVSPPMICECAHIFRSIRGLCAVRPSACAHASHLCVTVCTCVGTEQIRSAQETKGRGVDASLGLSFSGDAWSLSPCASSGTNWDGYWQ